MASDAADMVRIYLKELKLAGYNVQAFEPEDAPPYNRRVGWCKRIEEPYIPSNYLDISENEDGVVIMWSEETKDDGRGTFVIKPATIATEDGQQACRFVKAWLEGTQLSDLSYGTDESTEGETACADPS